MEIDAGRLRVLHAVAVGGGVVGAARLLHLTPQAISQQVARLERDVGVSLFDRSRRRLELTPAGVVLARRAARIDEELTAARRDLAEATGRLGGTVRIGTFQSVIRGLLVPALRLLGERHPQVIPMLIEETNASIGSLRRGIYDVIVREDDAEAILGAPPPGPGPTIASTLLLDDPYVVIGSPALGERGRSGRLPIDVLDRTPWIASPVGSASRVGLDRLIDHRGLPGAIAHECLEFPSVIAMVASGYGLAVVPSLALRLAPERVAIVEVGGLGARSLTAVQRTGRHGNEPAADAVVDALIAAVVETGDR